MKKFFFKMHQWLALPVGFIIFIICLSGAILAFQKEGNELLYPERYFVEQSREAPLPLSQLIPIVNSQLTDNEVVAVEMQADPKRTYSMTLKEGKKASVFVNPYNGKIVGKTQRGEGFFGKIMALHRWLLGGKESIGKHIVGISTIFFSLILLSGIVIWWPKTKKMLGMRLKVKTTAGRKRFIMDTHTSAGIYMVCGLLLLSLTGLFFAYSWYSNGVMKLLSIEAPADAPKDKAKEQPKDSSTTDSSPKAPQELHWDAVVSQLRQQNPSYSRIEIKKGQAAVAHPHSLGNVRAMDNYKFDNETGAIKKVELYADQPAHSRLRGWMYTLHTGSWAGIWSKVLMSLFALMGASLPLSGYYILMQKIRQKRVKRK